MPGSRRQRPALASPPPSAPSSPDWRAALAAWLHGRKSYPEAARRGSVQGSVVIRFTVARDGEIGDIAIVRSSGSAILDEAAMAMLRGAHAPAFSASMAGDRINVTVPVSYTLSR